MPTLEVPDTSIVSDTGDYWHPERVALIAFNSTHHLPPELHTEY